MLARAAISFVLASVALGGTLRTFASADVRSLWLEKMQLVCGKVLEAQAAGTLRRDLPPDPRRLAPDGSQLSNPQSAPFEAFARSLLGIAAWLELPPVDDAEGRLRARYLDWARQGVIKAVDPTSPGYLKLYHERQSLVECAYLVQAFWLAPRQLWDALPPETQSAVCEELLRNTWQPKRTNWLFFGSLPHLFVLEHGSAAQRARVQPERLLTAPRSFMEQFYRGDGWYGDGREFHFDYYNSYVIHPMLFDVLNHLHRLPDDRLAYLDVRRADVQGWLDAERPRFRRHAQFLERQVMPDGTYPQQGRSAQYRFGCFQALSYACLLAAADRSLSPCPPGQVRSALTAVLERQCTPANFDADGWLRIGFNGDQPSMAEMYCTPGSVYLCSAIFHVLGLPPTDEFWTAPACDWSSRKIWSGADFPRDHSLRDLDESTNRKILPTYL